jgi:Zn finger protein HypA/HybF involved in hydrogenase expression
MSEIAQQTTGLRSAATAVVHESYSFACMRCGHGWEQSYEIEHHIDGGGHEFVMYVADGEVVPSPLSRPTCQNCDGHVVRIMRPGQVSSVQNSLRRSRSIPAQAKAPEGPGAADEPDHHWHLSDLLHVFHRKAS